MADKEITNCVVCTNIDCASRGSPQLIENIKERLAAAGSNVKVTTYQCFGGCEFGPNLILYPEGTWYAGARPDDADAIAAHILGGPRVDRLTENVDDALRELMLDLLGSGIVDL
jgi:NADP-reducing hydrogenase subunit HndC